jgi:hypothetical protein
MGDVLDDLLESIAGGTDDDDQVADTSGADDTAGH